MTWNYRVIRGQSGDLALHEVYYDEAGKPNSYTERPACFGVEADEGIEALIAALETALKDAKLRPILELTEFLAT